MSTFTVLQVKEKWNRANYPLMQDRSIVKNILELKKEYQEKNKEKNKAECSRGGSLPDKFGQHL